MVPRWVLPLAALRGSPQVMRLETQWVLWTVLRTAQRWVMPLVASWVSPQVIRLERQKALPLVRMTAQQREMPSEPMSAIK